MDKIYVGNGTEKETQYGKLLSVTLDLDLLIKEYNNHGFLSLQGRKIKVTVLAKREKGQYGDTHYLTLDTWHPDSFNKPHPISIICDEIKEGIGPEDDIPF